MFDVPFARRRPMFGVSAALHAAFVLALVVPPLLATPEPPEPEVRMLPVFPATTVRIGDAPAQEKRDLLRKGNRGDATAAAQHTTNAPAPPRVALTQPTAVGVLPEPTGADEDLFTFEAPGERSEPGSGLPGGTGASGGGDAGGCEGCSPIPATALGVTPPVPLETISPVYPELARRAHIEGVVVLEAIIGANRSVRDVRVLRGASSLLDPVALEAVRRWRYRPARIGERPVAVYLNVVVAFSLKNL